MTIGREHRPLREVVAEELRAMILKGDLAAGERLLEDKLAEQLGVSRNPVREAIRSLEATGLVEVIPRRGAYVSRPDIGEMRKVLEVRGALESYAAETAASRLPDGLVDELTKLVGEGKRASAAGNVVKAAELHREFHLAIERAVDNPFLEQVVEPLRHRTEMAFSMVVDRRGDLGWSEHEAIRDAIARGDALEARSTVFTHIMSVLDDLEHGSRSV